MARGGPKGQKAVEHPWDTVTVLLTLCVVLVIVIAVLDHAGAFS